MDAANSKVYSINIETGEIKETLIEGVIERLDYQNDTLYVTVLARSHGSYWWEEGQSSTIVMIDADTMGIEDYFKIDIEPWDIVVGRDGIIYVTAVSGQTCIVSYSPDSKELIGKGSISARSGFAEIHPTLNRIYTMDGNATPRDYVAFNIDNGKFVSFYDSPYHGDYPLTTNFKISPDGKYLFNGSRVIFTCSEDRAKDMSFAFKLDKEFKDIAFNMEENKFYTAVGGNQIYVYNYKYFAGVSTISSIGEILKLFYVDGKLCALSKSANGRPMFEVIEDPKIKYGDINKDGKVNSTDITYLKGYLLRNSAYKLDGYSLLAADVDGNGSVTSIDFTYMKRYLLRTISDFPANNK